MHPDLLDHPLFLRYYQRWQQDPSSILFAPIAELLLTFDRVDDALRVCREGLRLHPELVTGRIAMAKIHLRRGNWEEAEEELRAALAIAPANPKAHALMEEVRSLMESQRAGAKGPAPEEPSRSPGLEVAPPWRTVTAANIFASQGHVEHARSIYEAILERDPDNDAARRGLLALPSAAP